MPLVSEAQRRYAYAHPEQEWTKEFIAATPKGAKLPERSRKGKKIGRRRYTR